MTSVSATMPSKCKESVDADSAKEHAVSAVDSVQPSAASEEAVPSSPLPNRTDAHSLLALADDTSGAPQDRNTSVEEANYAAERLERLIGHLDGILSNIAAKFAGSAAVATGQLNGQPEGSAETVAPATGTRLATTSYEPTGVLVDTREAPKEDAEQVHRQ
jgi:hypothetical protein